MIWNWRGRRIIRRRRNERGTRRRVRGPGHTRCYGTGRPRLVGLLSLLVQHPGRCFFAGQFLRHTALSAEGLVGFNLSSASWTPACHQLRSVAWSGQGLKLAGLCYGILARRINQRPDRTIQHQRTACTSDLFRRGLRVAAQSTKRRRLKLTFVPQRFVRYRSAARRAHPDVRARGVLRRGLRQSPCRSPY